MVSGDDRAPVESGASIEATLEELAGKLLELREDLKQVVTGLSRSASGGGAAIPGIAEGGLRCHACGRTRTTDQVGWTLRLCGDDELHPFCPSCDRRQVDGEGRDGRDARRYRLASTQAPTMWGR